MSEDQYRYAEGWMDGLGRMWEELRAKKLDSQAIEAIFDYCVEHYKHLDRWHNDGGSGSPPPLPPLD